MEQEEPVGLMQDEATGGRAAGSGYKIGPGFY